MNQPHCFDLETKDFTIRTFSSCIESHIILCCQSEILGNNEEFLLYPKDAATNLMDTLEVNYPDDLITLNLRSLRPT